MRLQVWRASRNLGTRAPRDARCSSSIDADVRAVVRGDVRRREDLCRRALGDDRAARSRSTTCSAYWPASVRSCIVVTTVSPSRRSSSTSSSTSCWRPRSSDVVGSSRSSTRRLLRERTREHGTLQLAAAERAERPLREVARARGAASACVAASRSRFPSPPRYGMCGVRPRRTYSATVSAGGVSGFCGTKATSRASARRPSRRASCSSMQHLAVVSGRARRARAAQTSSPRRSAR